MLLNMMNPQQRMMAQAFLSNPNRQQALQQLMVQNNVSQDQINSLAQLLNRQ